MAARSKAARSPSSAKRRTVAGRRWSRQVTEESHALDLESGVFTRSPAESARSLARSAEQSRRRKSSAFRSAMSMLTFYVNRAGRNLPAERKRALGQAKQELYKLYGRKPRGA